MLKKKFLRKILGGGGGTDELDLFQETVLPQFKNVVAKLNESVNNAIRVV